MSIWKDNTASRPALAAAPEALEAVRFDAPSKPELVPSPIYVPVASPDTGLPRKESLIAADITIEGKIEGEIKMIRTLQALLGVPVAEEQDLRAKTLEQLEAITSALQEQLRSR